MLRVLALVMLLSAALDATAALADARQDCQMLRGDAAIQACDLAIGEFPRDAEAYKNRGNAYLAKADLDRAIADYTKAIEIDQKYAKAYYGRGIAYEARAIPTALSLTTRRRSRSIRTTPTPMATAVTPTAPRAISTSPSPTIRKRSRSIRKTPTLTTTAAVAYGDKGDFDRATANFTKAIEIDPKDAFPYNNRCWLRAKANRDLPLALADCDAGVGLAPNNAESLDSRGFLYLRLGRFDEAIADYDAALKINPRLAGGLYGRGLAKRKKGDQAGGDADVAAARAIQADIADEYAKYGMN